jgi:hypothetical protein
MKIEIKIKDFEVLLSDTQDKSLIYSIEEIKDIIEHAILSYNQIDK